MGISNSTPGMLSGLNPGSWKSQQDDAKKEKAYSTGIQQAQDAGGLDGVQEFQNRMQEAKENNFSNYGGSSINAANADWSSIKGAYRFFDNDKVTPEKILEPHFENTAHRIYGQEFIIVAQDTSFIDFSSHKMTLGLGTATAIGDYEVKGVHFHAGLALSHEGTPLGLVYSKLWCREKQIKKGHNHTKIPMKMNESYRWIECLEKTKELLPSGFLILKDISVHKCWIN